MENKSRPNIIIFLVDAMRASSVSSYGFHLKTTPNIDKLAEDGVLFKNAFTSINATDSSITSIMTGKYPIHHGIHNQAEKVTDKEIKTFIKGRHKMLQSYLGDNGYKTFGLDWLGRWHKKGYDFYLGIVEAKKKKVLYQTVEKIIRKIKPLHKLVIKLYFSERFTWLSERFNPYEKGSELVEKANEIIKENNKPFFMFIHFWDTHAPYNCPPSLQKKFFDESEKPVSLKKLINTIKSKEVRGFFEALTGYEDDSRKIIAKYHGSINYCDKMIGEVVNTLKETGKFDNTLIFVTADHGESLIEHNILFDHHGLYEQNLKVPLIIHYPILGKNKVISDLVMNLDITPTILDILKINTKDKLDGVSLIKTIKGKSKRKYIFAEENYLQKKRCIRSQRYKYIFPQKGFTGCIRCGYAHGGIEELYDLNNDPREENNILDKKPELVKKLKNKAKEFFKDKEKTKVNSMIKSIKLE